MKFRILTALLLSLVFATAARADDAQTFRGHANGLALTPPMGWNSWNRFACDVNEAKVRAVADAMVASGMQDAGYRYIVIDDCWQASRDSQGNIVADATRFPSGIKALADYVHGKGLKFGLYSDAGTKTCGGRPGSKGYETQDARQYAAWGVDYLKYDWCSSDGQTAPDSYLKMSEALQASGRDIVFSICEWGTSKPWLWAKNIGNLWRTTGDIYDHWDGHSTYQHSVLEILDLNAELAPYAGPGHWNDPDMLEVGNGGMSDSEYRAHFSLWAMLAAPLIAGNDLAHMSEATKTILTNKDVIAVDQDALGKQATRVSKNWLYEVWARPLASGGHAVLLLNRSAAPHRITAHWGDIGVAETATARVRDLWTHEDLAPVAGEFSANVPAHGVVMVTVGP